MNEKTSIIWTPTKEKFQKIVSEQTSLAEILRYFGLHPGAGNYKTLKNTVVLAARRWGHTFIYNFLPKKFTNLFHHKNLVHPKELV